MERERRRRLRAAIYQGDGPTVVAVLSEPPMPDALQLTGDGLLMALAQRVDGVVELAVGCVTALHERRWAGDDELAAQLESALGHAAIPMLRPLAVDLEELAGVLEGDPVEGGGRIDLTTGEVWHASAIEYAREIGEESEGESEDAERWLWVDSQGSHDGYRDMELFIATVSDPGRADLLEVAIQGRGAFRRFKQVLARWPDERERWHALSEDRQRGRARAWLAGAGLRPAPSPQRPTAS